jgi:hypothetical protein
MLKGLIQGIQVFDGIPCAVGCNITNEESLAITTDILAIPYLISRLKEDISVLADIKEKVIGLLNNYSTISARCEEAMPAVIGRVHEVLTHVTSVEYVLKFSYRMLFDYQKFLNEYTVALKICFKKYEDTSFECGQKFGQAFYDVFLGL